MEADVATLEAQLEALGTVDPARFETKLVKPGARDITLLRTEIVWVY